MPTASFIFSSDQKPDCFLLVRKIRIKLRILVYISLYKIGINILHYPYKINNRVADTKAIDMKIMALRKMDSNKSDAIGVTDNVVACSSSVMTCAQNLEENILYMNFPRKMRVKNMNSSFSIFTGIVVLEIIVTILTTTIIERTTTSATTEKITLGCFQPHLMRRRGE